MVLKVCAWDTGVSQPRRRHTHTHTYLKLIAKPKALQPKTQNGERQRLLRQSRRLNQSACLLGFLETNTNADARHKKHWETSYGMHFGALASDIGFEVRSAESAMDTEGFLLDGLQARRDQLSGVNIDEELVNMLEYEQAFTAASQFIRVMSDVTNDLMSIL